MRSRLSGFLCGLFIVLLTLFFILAWGATAQAHPPAQEETSEPEVEESPTPEPGETISFEVTLADLDRGPLRLTGMHGSSSTWLSLPTDWLVNEIEVDLGYIASPLLHEQRASLTVLVNEDVVTSFRPIGDGSEHRETFIIPQETIGTSSGFSLAFEGLLRTTDDICEEWDNPGQWLTILDSTKLTITASENTTAPTLENLARTIVVRNPVDEPPPVVFVLPDDPDPVALTAAAKIAARLGEQIGTEGLPFAALTSSALTDELKLEANMIVIGLPATQPLIGEMADAVPSGLEGDTFLTADGIAAPPDHGVIEILNSPWNPARKILLISAGSDAGLARAGDAFANRPVFETLAGVFQFVEEAAVAVGEPTEGAWLGDKTTLGQLGFSRRVLEGPGVTNVFHTVRRPPGWIFENGAKLTLHLAYSPALEEGSHVAVFLNDAFIGTAEIGKGVSQTEFTFDLPVELLNETEEGTRPRSLSLQFVVANIVIVPECQTINPEAIWTRIQSESYFLVPHSYMALPDLNAFPYPFVGDSPDVPTAIVIPSEPTDTELSAALSLAAVMGSYAIRDTHLNLLTTDQVSEAEYADANLIVLGERARQPLVDQFMAGMPPIPGGGLYQDLERATTGILREEVSPWNAERMVLLVFGESDEAFVRAAEALYTSVPPVNAPGTIVVIEVDQSPRIIAGAAEAPAAEEPEEAPPDETIEVEVQ
ncbi:MAG: cellulose biosynthesis cyclic di-GMP-binding regulatory protein BcsB [Anaerolineae bacterium]|nr:cellulose biosynthesis cyclic di-GMP-binding regulatory protein BcsB [Anaerolineae bacterium]